MVESIPDPLTRSPRPHRAWPRPFPLRSVAGSKPCWNEPPPCSGIVSNTRMTWIASSRVTAIAEQWLDMGERDRARLVLQEVTISHGPSSRLGFLGQLARLEPDQIQARLQKLLTPQVNPSYRDRSPGRGRFPARDRSSGRGRAGLQSASKRRPDELPSVRPALRLCRRLARVDPPRARRVAASLGSPGTRACAWASVALGLAEKDKAGASEAMDRAIQEIDRLRESGLGLRTGRTRSASA